MKAAVIGSGVVGTAVAHVLAGAGHTVEVFEKGRAYPYPHVQTSSEVAYAQRDPGHELPPDLRDVVTTGTYQAALGGELIQRVGGMATTWRGLALRFRPEDFRPASLHGYGTDWPLGYGDLEPWYGSAETFLGVAGSDDGNPFAPPRSTPYPLPPLAVASADESAAERLRAAGIALSTTPQAIASRDYDGRPACSAVGPTCNTCPTGARYSPAAHLARAEATGRCHVHSEVAVRRILTEGGRARALVVQGNDESVEREVGADIVVCAGGALESARLLLLSAGGVHRDGIGNHAGHVGRHLTFHHMWTGALHQGEDLLRGWAPPMMMQSHQFVDPAPGRGGIKVELTRGAPFPTRSQRWASASQVVADLRAFTHTWRIGLHAETVAGPEKYLRLSGRRDRFGDRFAHVHYGLSDFDLATHAFGARLVRRFAEPLGAQDYAYPAEEDFTSVYHHMGTCRMSERPTDGVVDTWGRVHGTANLFVLGGATFAGPTALNPTLTMVALALRTAAALATDGSA